MKPAFRARTDRSLRSLFYHLSIGRRLMLGFGLIVALTLLVIGLSYIGSVQATSTIDRTGDERVPVALVASRAEANLLRMLASVRGYLALGDPDFRKSYDHERAAFADNLATLQARATNVSPENKHRLDDLKSRFAQWQPLPERLFALRDDQLDREPAYRLLATDGARLAGGVLINTQHMIDSQALQPPSAANVTLLRDMAAFQSSFASMFSALRGYTTTRNRVFRVEYEANLAANSNAWDRLRQQRSVLNANQQQTLDGIAERRTTFLALPDKLFTILEGNRWREDLYLFSTEALPVGDQMLSLLDELTADQQALLEVDLASGRAGLALANRQMLIGGLLALLLGALLALLFRRSIAGPVGRLTAVAERIRGGELTARATVESGDEIGRLAAAFNNMTGQLQRTLVQARNEKKRADNLLEVVIPIGVALASEKNFNRLLEQIVTEARSFCNADGGVLYLRTEDEHLRPVIVQSASRKIALGGTTGAAIPFPPLSLYDAATAQSNGRNVAVHAALTGETVNIANAYRAADFDIPGPSDFDETTGYPSLLSIPLKNSREHVIGVLQLLDAQDDSLQIVPFDANLQQMVESLSSLAVAALEAYIREQSLRREIQQLRIEIDESKSQKQVSEIVNSDFFQDLQAKARSMRGRNRGLVPALVDSTLAPHEPDDLSLSI